MCSLKKRQDFEMVFKEGVTFSSKYLVMYARPNGLSLNRLGLSVSKKIGKAVMRNRLRRLLREAMRRLLSEGSCGQEVALNYDFIIIARRLSVEAGLDDFIREIKGFMIKITELTVVSLRGVPTLVGTTKQSQKLDSSLRSE